MSEERFFFKVKFRFLFFSIVISLIAIVYSRFYTYKHERNWAVNNQSVSLKKYKAETTLNYTIAIMFFFLFLFATPEKQMG